MIASVANAKQIEFSASREMSSRLSERIILCIICWRDLKEALGTVNKLSHMNVCDNLIISDVIKDLTLNCL